MRVGVFDSGIGGLNVLKEILKQYPCAEYIYYGDTKNLPYGDKNPNELLELSKKILNFFYQKKVDLIIIACGTVSSNCYQTLKKISKIKIIDIISPTISYLKALNKNKIAIFGTNRTIDSHIFSKNLTKEILEIATPEFVPMIEKKQIDLEIIKKYTNLVKDYEVLVLGCTHYPIIKNELKKYLKEKTLIVDMGTCLLEKIQIVSSDNFKIELYFTKIDEILKENIKMILDYDYELYQA